MESSAKVLRTCSAWEDTSLLKIGLSLVMIGSFSTQGLLMLTNAYINLDGEPFGIRSCYSDLTSTFRLISVQFATKSYKFFSVRLVKINLNSLARNLNFGAESETVKGTEQFQIGLKPGCDLAFGV